MNADAVDGASFRQGSRCLVDGQGTGATVGRDIYEIN